MLKSNLIAAIQFKIRRHNWTTYMQDGIVRPGCSTCQEMINTTSQFTEHVALAIPGLIERLSEHNTATLKSSLITATQREIQKHDLDSYRKDGTARYGCARCDVQIGSHTCYCRMMAPLLTSGSADIFASVWNSRTSRVPFPARCIVSAREDRSVTFSPFVSSITGAVDAGAASTHTVSSSRSSTSSAVKPDRHIGECGCSHRISQSLMEKLRACLSAIAVRVFS
jgi:hypothetical protein